MYVASDYNKEFTSLGPINSISDDFSLLKKQNSIKSLSDTRASESHSCAHPILIPPPLALMTEPVIHLASRLHSKPITSATSSVWPNFGIDCKVMNSCLKVSKMSGGHIMTDSV